jgi:hypothetical protein
MEKIEDQGGLKESHLTPSSQCSKTIHILTIKMLSYLPNITLYLEEEGKERFYVNHMGNGQFLINGNNQLLWPWTDVLIHYKQDPTLCPRKDCLTDILFVAKGLYKDNTISSLMNEIFLLPEPSLWKKVGQDEAPYEPYKSLDKLPRATRLFVHRNLGSCLSVVHVGKGLFEVPGHGSSLYNRHQLLAFYDTLFICGPKEPVDPLTTLYIEQGIRKGDRLDLLFAESLADEEWARVGSLDVPEPEPSISALLERLHKKEFALQQELKDLDHVRVLHDRVKKLEAQVQEALCYAPLDDEASLLHREAEAEGELARLEHLTKRSKNLDIQIGQARMVWCYEELAGGEEGLAKREQEAAEELAELEILQTKVTALKALEKKVEEARKVLETV